MSKPVNENPTWLMLEQGKQELRRIKQDVSDIPMGSMLKYEMLLTVRQAEESLYKIQLELENKLISEQ